MAPLYLLTLKLTWTLLKLFYCYFYMLILLALIWHGFHGAIKEADGDRILQYWKFLLIIIKSAGKKNYGIELCIFCSSTITSSLRHRNTSYFGIDV